MWRDHIFSQSNKTTKRSPRVGKKRGGKQYRACLHKILGLGLVGILAFLFTKAVTTISTITFYLNMVFLTLGI